MISSRHAVREARVTAICPGNRGISDEQVRQTCIDQVPMKRGCTYTVVCNMVVFLASDQASTMTGQAINVTGGQEMR
jgi:sorbitol-6-phosphate 2-dehydrogenase